MVNWTDPFLPRPALRVNRREGEFPVRQLPTDVSRILLLGDELERRQTPAQTLESIRGRPTHYRPERHIRMVGNEGRPVAVSRKNAATRRPKYPPGLHPLRQIGKEIGELPWFRLTTHPACFFVAQGTFNEVPAPTAPHSPPMSPKRPPKPSVKVLTPTNRHPSSNTTRTGPPESPGPMIDSMSLPKLPPGSP